MTVMRIISLIACTITIFFHSIPLTIQSVTAQSAPAQSVFGDLDQQPSIDQTTLNDRIFNIFRSREKSRKVEDAVQVETEQQVNNKAHTNGAFLLPSRNPERSKMKPKHNTVSVHKNAVSNTSAPEQTVKNNSIPRAMQAGLNDINNRALTSDVNTNLSSSQNLRQILAETKTTQPRSQNPSQNSNEITVTDLPDRVPQSSPAASPKQIFSYLLTLKMPEAEKQNLLKAVNAFYRKDFEAGLTAKAKLTGKTTYKIAHWYYLRSEAAHASPHDIKSFYKKNPEWPNRKLLRKRAERSLYQNPPAQPRDVESFFQDMRPITAEGKIILAKSYYKQNKTGLAQKYFAKAWRHPSLDAKTESLILKDFAKLLPKEDLKYRIDLLLIKNKKANIARAMRIAKLLGGNVPKTVSARASVIHRKKSATQLLDELPQDLKKDTGIKFSKIQHYRRTKAHSKSWDILHTLHEDEAKEFTAEEWWKEKRRQLRIALRNKKYQLAYKIAQNHGQLARKYYWEAEFLAGWIALRFLSDAEKAKQHFLALSTSVTTDEAKAKSLYWLGRAAVILQQNQLANEYFAEATKFNLTYYGQIAEDTLGGVGRQILPTNPIKPTPEDINKFFNRDAVKAISVTYHANFNTFTPLFLLSLAQTLESPGEISLLIKMARIFGYPSVSVRIAKIAMTRGFPFQYFAYPTDLIRKPVKQFDPRVDPAFVYALARQESEFNPKAVSPVGALGLMQIMPGTAKEIANRHGIRFNPKRLATDDMYGLKLGTAHIGDLIQNYHGSLILTLVAYNAGPRRVREWIKAYGDPRLQEINVIDWVEHIPFGETRNYVKKIMASLQVYRSYLSSTPKPHQIMIDLKRGSKRAAKTKIEQASNRPAR